MTKRTRSMISFDWAMKRLLRNKANFEVLEGFLSELLFRKIVIRHIAESEGTPKDKDDKTNRVDIFVEADEKELVIIELQFNSQDDYFQRMLYGASRAITDHIDKGDPYSEVRKVYSVNIVYFDLGVGDDYIYRGVTNFIGLHTNNELKLSAKQQQLYRKTHVSDLFAEYVIIKVNGFDGVAKDTLDEWVYYLKNNAIRDEFTAQGIEKAREVLAYDNLGDDEKKAYQREIENRRNQISEFVTAYTDGKFEGEAIGLEKGEAIGLEKGEAIGLEKGEAIGLEKGEAIGRFAERSELQENTVINSNRAGLSKEIISAITGLTLDQIKEILRRNILE